MNFYKNEQDNFFFQCDNTPYDNKYLTQILVEQHHGDCCKHHPNVICENQQVKVKIGDIMHPMTQDHHISMIFLKTKQGGQYKILSYQETPIVTFELSKDDQPLEIYSYCNLHGLWKENI